MFITSQDALKSALSQLPTISQGQAEDLKIETQEFRVWLSRLTKEDGMSEDNEILIERFDGSQWLDIKN